MIPASARLRVALAAAASVLAFAHAHAADSGAYPAKPVRMVIPYAPGGGVDLVARMFGQRLSAHFGQAVVIDNRGGAGGVLGTDLVAKAIPDGYTLLLHSSSFASTPYFFKKLPYDSLNDLVPVTLVGRNFGQVLVVSPGFPAQSIKEFIALARAKPGTLHYGSAGNGNVMHLAGELFEMLAGVKMSHVPYKGGANVMGDIVSGQIQAAFPAAHSTVALIKSGRLRALGITGEKRWAQLPEVPTLEESGIKGYRFVGWYGLWFPARTAAPHVERMRQATADIMKDQETRQRFEELGIEGVGSTPAEFRRVILDELALNRKLTTSIGIVPQ